MSFSQLKKLVESTYPNEEFKFLLTTPNFQYSKTLEVYFYHPDQDISVKRYCEVLNLLKDKPWAPKLLNALTCDDGTAIVIEKESRYNIYTLY